MERSGSRPSGRWVPDVLAALIDVALTASYPDRGKTLLVSFWATWADPVRKDLPELVKTYQKHHDQGFEIIGVCLDGRSGGLHDRRDVHHG